MKVISIIIKDLKTVLSDKQAIITTMLMPVILMTILSMALKGSFISSDDVVVEEVKIAVVKQYNEITDSEIFTKTLEEKLDIALTGDEVNPEETFFEDFLGSKEVSKLITKENQAVLLQLENGNHHIITKYDIINSIK